jgi:hypothetical protein
MDVMKLETTPIRVPDHDFWYQDPEPLLAEWERSQWIEKRLFWLATGLGVSVFALFFFAIGLTIGLNR